jgi:phosphate transport system regulatory protein PhoU
VPETRKAFHEQLEAIRRDLIVLAAKVTEAIPRGTEALLTLDMAAAQRLIDGDDDLDALTLDIEERCFSMMALQQPMAGDLRALVAALRMTAEIERSGDLVVNIAKGARRMYGAEIPARLRGQVGAMSDEAERLFRLAIDAYADGDADLAGALDDVDDRLDRLHADYIASIIDRQDELDLQVGVQLALIGRYYERIGDHAVNIGERVRYMVTGWLPEHTGAARLAARIRATDDASAEEETTATATSAPLASATTQVESRLMRALGAIPQGIMIFDTDRTLAYRNESAAGYLAARHGDALAEEAIAQVVDDVVGDAGSEAGLSERTVELFGPPRRTLVLRAIPLPATDDDPASTGVLVIIDDVSERRHLEAVRRDFVANISHELKTPVGAIALLAETLAAEDDQVVARGLAERLVDEAFRVDRTIDDLLELSWIEIDEGAIREHVSIQDCVTEAVARVRPGAQARQIDIVVAGPAQERSVLSVLGDRRQLVSAVYNLLENAVKYSDAGSTVEVRARSEDSHVVLDIEDHGIGIPRRDVERVFERFYRVDRGRSRETGGTGLGLAIVRHAAVNHRGEVLVESLEGAGSTFTLRLPAGPVPSPVPDEAG